MWGKFNSRQPLQRMIVNNQYVIIVPSMVGSRKFIIQLKPMELFLS